MQLQNWRGVSEREIEFSAQVTIVEGPNEAGKSSLLEALLMLLRDKSSSNARSVKAVKPVGLDVGSRVSAEFILGDHHLVYSKTYNKNKSTELRVNQPKVQQLTGEEAHNYVDALLNQHLDQGLWRALLVEQGESLLAAKLRESNSLANALDQAAATSAGVEATESLYAAVREEYLRYFTDTGREKIELTRSRDLVASTKLEQAAAAEQIQLLELDLQNFEQCSQKLLHQQQRLPALEAELQQAEHLWTPRQASMAEQRSTQQALADLVALCQSLEARLRANAQRQSELGQKQAQLAECTARELQDQAQLEELGERLQAQEARTATYQARVRTVREQLVQAKALEQHQRQQLLLTAIEKRLAELGRVQEAIQQQLTQASENGLDDDALEAFRTAVGTLAVARASRDAAATRISLEALARVDLDVGEESLTLDPGETRTHQATEEMRVLVPGVMKIHITPALSVGDSQLGLEAAQARLNELQSTYGVADLAAAIAANARRNQAQAELTRLRQQQAHILAEETELELREEAHRLRVQMGESVNSGDPAAEDLEQKVAHLERQLAEAETALEQNRASFQTQQTTFAKHSGRVQSQAAQNQALAISVRELEQSLQDLNSQGLDQGLRKELSEHQSRETTLRQQLAAFDLAWQANTPESVQQQFENMAAVVQRAKSELAELAQMQAVLADRLQQARADGRFDRAVTTEQTHKQAARDFVALQRRSEAAKRLWETVSRHREDAQRAYVQPLVVAVGQLGQSVFKDPNFAVEIDQEWTLQTRTLFGITLPFAALSVGAQEQLGILLRLAAAQIVARAGSVPLIIDDALGYADSERLKSMGAAIAVAGRSTQIIVLTCVPERFAHVGNANLVSLT